MKKVLCAMLAAASLMGCAQTNESQTASQTAKNDEDMNKKSIVVYFSHTGENYGVGYIEEGNTAVVAKMIADATGADTFEIVPEKAYPTVYNDCVDLAKKELQANARPAIKGDVDLAEYDVVYLGYPNWWGEPPMCVFTFIEGHDWAGKKVIPFITHEGSGMGGTDSKIAAACKGADVAVGKGLAVRGEVAQNQREQTRQTVNSWLDNL